MRCGVVSFLLFVLFFWVPGLAQHTNGLTTSNSASVSLEAQSNAGTGLGDYHNCDQDDASAASVNAQSGSENASSSHTHTSDNCVGGRQAYPSNLEDESQFRGLSPAHSTMISREFVQQIAGFPLHRDTDFIAALKQQKLNEELRHAGLEVSETDYHDVLRSEKRKAKAGALGKPTQSQDLICAVGTRDPRHRSYCVPWGYVDYCGPFGCIVHFARVERSYCSDLLIQLKKQEQEALLLQSPSVSACSASAQSRECAASTNSAQNLQETNVQLRHQHQMCLMSVSSVVPFAKRDLLSYPATPPYFPPGRVIQ